VSAGKNFHYRGFISLLLALSFVVSVVSGAVLFIAPPGRIAHWTNWKLWGLTKEGWETVHTIFALLLLITGILHLLWFNWGAFWGYVKRKAERGIKLKRELALSVILSAFILVGAIVSVPPFSSLMDLGEKIKGMWEEAKKPPPIPHAELMPLEELLQKLSIPFEDALKKLEASGIKVKDKRAIVKDIARENGLSPLAIYEIITKDIEKQIPASGEGYGRKTLKEVCEGLNIPLEAAISMLKERGIEASGDEKMREISSRYGMSPISIVNILATEIRKKEHE